MPETNTEEKKGTYLNVMSDGKFHQKVEEGTPGAVLREGELKDGTKYSKWELLSDEITGTIKNVDTFDGGYGKNLNLRMDVRGEDVSISFSVANTRSFGEDMLHKILAINLNIPVTLTLEFVESKKLGKNGEKFKNKVVKVVQNNQEIHSYFKKWDGDLKKFIPQNGMPEAPIAKVGKEISSDVWNLYFMQARLFMIDAVESHFGVGVSEADKKFNA